MIIDCHTHIWTDVKQLGEGAEAYLRRQSDRESLSATPADHELATRCVDKALVMGFRSVHLSAAVPNSLVADYVATRSERLVGIAGIDPMADGALAEAEELLERPEFRGLAISPSRQCFHPANSRAMDLYELASERKVPVFCQQGTHFPSHGRMEYARPLLLDEIATEFPDLTLVIATMGHPWVEEGIALIGKHPRVFADLAGLVRRPWQAYNAMVLAYQFNVADKVLFGSDFPFFTAAEAIESVYRMHEITQGTNLPTVPREVLRSIVERNALELLGIARPGELAETPPEAEEEPEEEEIQP